MGIVYRADDKAARRKEGKANDDMMAKEKALVVTATPTRAQDMSFDRLTTSIHIVT